MGLLMGKIRPFSMELLPFLPLKNGFWSVFLLLFMISEWNFTDMLNSKGYILQRRTVTLNYLSSSWVICPWLILSISVLLLFRHYISHKITFGAPSSGGVLCSACGAFICISYKTILKFIPVSLKYLILVTATIRSLDKNSTIFLTSVTHIIYSYPKESICRSYNKKSPFHFWLLYTPPPLSPPPPANFVCGGYFTLSVRP